MACCVEEGPRTHLEARPYNYCTLFADISSKLDPLAIQVKRKSALSDKAESALLVDECYQHSNTGPEADGSPRSALSITSF
jgi:hypothetical protein